MFRRSFCGVLFLSLALLASVIGIEGSSSTCQCSAVVDSTRQHAEFHDRVVEFETADVVGESFQRAKFASPKHKKRERMFSAMNSETSTNCDSEQIHVTLGGNGYNSVTFSFVTTNFSLTTESIVYVSTDENILQRTFEELNAMNGDQLLKANGNRIAFSELIYIYSFLYSPPMGEPLRASADIVALENTADWAYDPQTGEHWSNYKLVTTPYTGFGEYNNPYMYYDSPYIHTAKLSSGLVSGQKYYYRVAGSCVVYSFKIPTPLDFPMTVALTGDVGQTEVSERTFTAMEAINADYSLLVGDLSYADGFPALWDSFGLMIEPYAANSLMLTTGGNHEYGFGENAVSYQARWPTPYEGSGSSYPCYWGREVGVTHVIALCSYAGFMEGSLQYVWLKNYLAKNINRQRTPWIIAMMHTPFYNSNNGHWMEGELMRRSIEPILYEYGVDIVLSGHVHSYERTYPIFNNTLDECGITYLNLGDGGNYEAAYANWTYISGAVPEWSAFREGSFGVGALTILDSTMANYSWHRHACGSADANSYHMNFSDYCSTPNDNSVQKMVTSDHFLIERPSIQNCPNRYVSTTTDVPQPDPAGYDDDSASDVISSDDDGDYTVSEEASNVLALAVTTGMLVLLCLGMAIQISRINAKIEEIKADSAQSHPAREIIN